MMFALFSGAALFAATGSARAQAGPASTVDVPKIAYTRFALPNGLTVVLHEDHVTPLVAVNLEYYVGSKDELPGKRGLAHLFEHMMFEGSAYVAPGEHGRIVQEAGGTKNGHTFEDRTEYVNQVPSNMLETVIWLEAERMAFLPARLDSERFERARDAVLNEYGQTFDGLSVNAGNLGGEALLTGLFPDPHPYATSVFGVMSELSATTVRDVQAFFDKYYAPNNATLAIVGDFATADARAMIERYFGGIPRRGAVVRAAVPTSPLTREKRLALEDKRANTLQLWIGWRGAAAASKDRIALTALGAILSGSRTSRLYRALVDERKLATGLPANRNGHFDLESAGIFQIIVTGNPNVSMTEIERVVDSVVAGVREAGVQPDELRRWLATYTVSSITRLQPVAAKAALLAEGQLLHGDPSALLAEVTAARRLTVADLQRVARQYLIPGRVVMSVVPAGKLELLSKPNEPYVNKTRGKAP